MLTFILKVFGVPSVKKSDMLAYNSLDSPPSLSTNSSFKYLASCLPSSEFLIITFISLIDVSNSFTSLVLSYFRNLE